MVRARGEEGSEPGTLRLGSAPALRTAERTAGQCQLAHSLHCVTHPHAHRSLGSGGIATPISQVKNTGLSQLARPPVSERESRMWPSPEPPRRLIGRLTERAVLRTPGSLIPEQAGRGSLPDFPLPHPPSPSPPSTEPRTDSTYYNWPRPPKAIPPTPPDSRANTVASLLSSLSSVHVDTRAARQGESSIP